MTVVSGLFKSSSLGKKTDRRYTAVIIRHILWLIFFLSFVQISLQYVTKGP